MRQIVLDTETTGLEVTQGHRIIEIGGVELVNRRLTGRHFHQYINPERAVDPGAFEVHGIGDDFLADKPRFAQIVDAFLHFVDGAELVIHNAPFDIGFLNSELGRLGVGPVLEQRCAVVDTLQLARRRHPGQRNNLDALCQRYAVDNSQRDLHGALLDAEILADVYLAMTGGQTAFALGNDQDSDDNSQSREAGIRRLSADRRGLTLVAVSAEERAAHEHTLDAIAASNGGKVLWRDQSANSNA